MSVPSAACYFQAGSQRWGIQREKGARLDSEGWFRLCCWQYWAVGSELLLDGPAHSQVMWVSWLSHPLPASVSLAEHTNLAIYTSRVALGITWVNTAKALEFCNSFTSYDIPSFIFPRLQSFNNFPFPGALCLKIMWATNLGHICGMFQKPLFKKVTQNNCH